MHTCIFDKAALWIAPSDIYNDVTKAIRRSTAPPLLEHPFNSVQRVKSLEARDLLSWKGSFCHLVDSHASLACLHMRATWDMLMSCYSFSVPNSKESRMNGQYQQTVDVLNNDNKWVPWKAYATANWFISAVSLQHWNHKGTSFSSELMLMTWTIWLWLPQMKSIWSRL